MLSLDLLPNELRVDTAEREKANRDGQDASVSSQVGIRRVWQGAPIYNLLYVEMFR